MKGLHALMKEVLEPGWCVACGACVGLCPYLSFYDGRVVCTDTCSRDQGRCYEVCPRTLDPPAEREHGPLGPVQAVYRARSADAFWRRAGQYGGTVSALLWTALQEGLVSKAVLTTGHGNGSPHGTVARTREEIASCAGSRFVGGGALSAFNREAHREPGSCALVALPCQAMALSNLRASTSSHEEHVRSIGVVIGLFCTWALDHRTLTRFLIREGVSAEPRKTDIPPPPADIFQVMEADRTLEFPLDRIRPMRMKGCSLCPDMTAEQADVSVGALEGDTAWNTLLVRTDRGRALVERAVDTGALEITDMPETNRIHLEEASLGKRARGRAESLRRVKESG